MQIILNQQAKEALETNKIPSNTGGIFQDGNDFTWFVIKSDYFDCGSEKSFNEAFNKIKK
jgi:hypothetical protein